MPLGGALDSCLCFLLPKEFLCRPYDYELIFKRSGLRLYIDKFRHISTELLPMIHVKKASMLYLRHFFG